METVVFILYGLGCIIIWILFDKVTTFCITKRKKEKEKQKPEISILDDEDKRSIKILTYIANNTIFRDREEACRHAIKVIQDRETSSKQIARLKSELEIKKYKNVL
ncbi:MAG: hypothetical protein J6U54_07670 [Clostridiales bacterium]|nr:hypothetical protein [Clostridiales bacterium]